METPEIILVTFGSLILLFVIFYLYVGKNSYSERYLSEGRNSKGERITHAEDIQDGGYYVGTNLFTKGFLGRFWLEEKPTTY